MSEVQEQSLVGSSSPQVLITRVFDAPRTSVFNAWSSAEHLQRWYAPHGCTIPFCSVDFRVGGVIHVCIRNPQFGDCWCKGFYREIVAPERIVYSFAFSDAEGNFVDAGCCSPDPEWPRETVITITFTEQDGKTTLRLHQTVSEAAAKRTGAHPSWIQMLDRLSIELAKTTLTQKD